jgi:Carboxypeptidase regulatory-like domain
MLRLPVHRTIAAASLLAFALSHGVCKAADAQLGTGTVNGTVTDTTGAAIQGASLTLANDETNMRISVQSNGAGHFSTLRSRSAAIRSM